MYGYGCTSTHRIASRLFETRPLHGVMVSAIAPDFEPMIIIRSSHLVLFPSLILIIHSALGLPLIIFPSSGLSNSNLCMLLRLMR